ncbi:MAG TPA: hypothetical protein VMG58_02895, partial [Candidatus Sulfotelmatobacter sp.]|nr:hypothetical protein [Candidatus Sulfotelmatobacter sp.]
MPQSRAMRRAMGEAGIHPGSLGDAEGLGAGVCVSAAGAFWAARAPAGAGAATGAAGACVSAEGAAGAAFGCAGAGVGRSAAF